MSRTTGHLGRRGLYAAAAGVLALGGATTVGLHLAQPDGSPAAAAGRDVVAAPPSGPGRATPSPQLPAGNALPPTPVPPPPTPPAATEQPAPDFGPVLPGSRPLTVTIPAIGVVAEPLVDLEVGADGVLAAPVDYARAGWHVAGPAPGQLGPAVIAGHVDGPDGPAVFYRLGELVPGDQVHVAREDGTTATFVVDGVGRYPKHEFPTSQVYGDTTGRAEIRLITCGGAFDRGTGHYVDNVVVFGHLL